MPPRAPRSGTVEEAGATLEGWVNRLLPVELRRRASPIEWDFLLCRSRHLLRIEFGFRDGDAVEWKLTGRRDMRVDEVQVGFNPEAVAEWCKDLSIGEVFQGTTTFRGTFEEAAVTVEGWANKILPAGLHQRDGSHDWVFDLGGGKHILRLCCAWADPDALEWKLTEPGREKGRKAVELGFTVEAFAAWCKDVAGSSKQLNVALPA